MFWLITFIFAGGYYSNENEDEKSHQKLLAALHHKRVATFGDSDPLNPGDWVQIMLSRLPPTTAFDDDSLPSAMGTCQNVVLHLHVEIAHAKIGSFANPQSKIVGVNYKFSPAKELKFQCVGFGACKNPSKTQRIEISSSVQFIDVTQPALDYFAEYPVIEAKLPHDFFYPFLTSDSVSGGMKIVYSGVLLPIIIVLCFAVQVFYH